MYLLTAANKIKRIRATAKGMDGQIKLTTYTNPERHKTHRNLLKSTPFKPTLKESDGADGWTDTGPLQFAFAAALPWMHPA